MWHFLNHWIYQDIWEPVWPNWVAAIPISLYGVVKVKAWDKRRVIKQQEHHDEQMRHIDNHFEALHKNMNIKQKVKIQHGN